LQFDRRPAIKPAAGRLTGAENLCRIVDLQHPMSSMSSWLQRKPALHFCLWRLGLSQAATQTSPAERECLARHASGKRRLAEIGVWHGVNTRELRRVMAADGVLMAIDPFPPSRFGPSFLKLIAQAEVARVANGRVEFLEMLSAAAAEKLGGVEFDFVFVDGDHSWEGVSTDWSLWSPKIAEEGIIALHDSRSHAGRSIDHTAVVRFTRQFIHHDDRFQIVDEVDSLTVLRRLPGES
jgi:predicted O-methyltransferase YrrM